MWMQEPLREWLNLIDTIEVGAEIEYEKEIKKKKLVKKQGCYLNQLLIQQYVT